MITTIKSMFDVIDGCEWDRLRDFYGHDCVYERPGYAPLEGLPSLEIFYRHERRIASGRHVVVDHYEKPDGIMVIGEFSGTLRDGAPVSLRYADAYDFSGGLIERRRTFFYTPLV
jgi:ketosteroid isomerase-like protein